MTYRQRLAWRRRAKHAIQIFKLLCGVAAACCFLLVLGSVGAIERGTMTIAEGVINMVLSFGGMFLFGAIAGCRR